MVKVARNYALFFMVEKVDKGEGEDARVCYNLDIHYSPKSEGMLSEGYLCLSREELKRMLLNRLGSFIDYILDEDIPKAECEEIRTAREELEKMGRYWSLVWDSEC